MKISRFAFISLAAGAFLVLLWLVGGNAYARYRERQIEHAWIQSFGPRQRILDRYPKTRTNDTARRLEKLADPLGLDLTAQTRESWSDAVTTAKAGQEEAEEGWQAISRYLTSQVEKPEAAIAPAPKDVEDFFEAYGTDLSALAAELATAPAPLWGFDPSLLSSQRPIPNLIALMRLQKALLGGVLAHSGSKNLGASSQLLEASWKLNQKLRETPDIRCQVVALAIARLQVGALRKVNVDANLWQIRIGEHDFKRSILDTQLLDLWPNPEMYRELEKIELRSGKKPLKRLEALFVRPCQEIGWSEDGEKMRLAYLRIKDSPLSDQEFSEINHSLRMPMPNLLDTFRRADRLVLDTELTAKILQARELRLQNGGRWPAAIPGIETSRFPGAGWIYSVSPDGMMSLSLSNGPHWDTSGPVLPTRFTSS